MCEVNTEPVQFCATVVAQFETLPFLLKSREMSAGVSSLTTLLTLF